MRRVMATFAVIAICMLAVGCHAGNRHSSRSAKTTSSTTTTTAPPVAENGLKALLLKPEEVDPIMQTTEMAITQRHDAMSDDSATMEPRECLAVDGAAQTLVYARSGYSAIREQTLKDEDFDHYVDQAVVLFPFAKQATAFFDESAKQWPACDQYTHTQTGSEWTTGPISNANGILSTTASQENAGSSGWACGRALVARNNVIVDVNTCSADPGDSAVVIAKQIADRVPTTKG